MPGNKYLVIFLWLVFIMLAEIAIIFSLLIEAPGASIP